MRIFRRLTTVVMLALLAAACVPFGSGGGSGYSFHARHVIVADGTSRAAERLSRVLTNDPGTGVMRHTDAGYEEAILTADQGQ